jgi:hypothetical protein
MDEQRLHELVARAADLCLGPYRHGVRCCAEATASGFADDESEDCCLLIEARDAEGTRCPRADLELELYRSGNELNLMLSRISQDDAPLLWHGSHPVWMQAASGERCERPIDGAPLEALCRRLRALLGGVQT